MVTREIPLTLCMNTCPNCVGHGYVDDDDGNHDCDMCDGSGAVAADFDPLAAGWFPVAYAR